MSSNRVDRASNGSFPASEPTFFAPVTGTSRLPDREVMKIGGKLVVHVPKGRGEELRIHLASHGISSIASTAAETEFDRVEIDDEDRMEEVQVIVDQWEG